MKNWKIKIVMGFINLFKIKKQFIRFLASGDER